MILDFHLYLDFLNHRVLKNIFWPRSADPDVCKVIDCTHDGAKDACPQKCSEDDLCKMAECSEPEATLYCPITCGERNPKGTKKRTKKGTKGREKFSSVRYPLLVYKHPNTIYSFYGVSIYLNFSFLNGI